MNDPNRTRRPDALDGVSERIDALEGHLAQLLARQRQGTPEPATPAARSGWRSPDAPGPSDDSGRIVRSDLQFGDEDADGFDERFNAFTDQTPVDEQSRNWLLS